MQPAVGGRFLPETGGGNVDNDDDILGIKLGNFPDEFERNGRILRARILIQMV